MWYFYNILHIYTWGITNIKSYSFVSSATRHTRWNIVTKKSERYEGLEVPGFLDILV